MNNFDSLKKRWKKEMEKKQVVETTCGSHEKTSRDNI